MATDINIITLDSVDSTNTWLSANAANLPDFSVVMTHKQTAGRGQRGNSWESEPGKNLTFSLLLRPNILAKHQFTVSQAVALGVTNALRAHLPSDAKVCVKWPNDIYVGNKKICGILIENVLIGDRIGHTIVGIGINVNQSEFHSDAPNPVSIIQLTRQATDLNLLLTEVVRSIADYLNMPINALRARYFDELWGRDGLNYRDCSTGVKFHATIEDIAPMGHITLRETSPAGTLRTYAFKEVAVILPS